MNSKTIKLAGIAAAGFAAYYFLFRKGAATTDTGTAAGATIAANTLPFWMPNAAQSQTTGVADPAAVNPAPGSSQAASPGSLQAAAANALAGLGTLKPATDGFASNSTRPYQIGSQFSNVSSNPNSGFIVDANGNKMAGNSTWDGAGAAPDWAVIHPTKIIPLG